MQSQDHASQETMRRRGPAAGEIAPAPSAHRAEPGLMDPANLLRLQRTAGNAAVDSLVQREKGGAALLDKPVVTEQEGAEIPAAQKDDDVLAEGIFDEEHEILNQWGAALDVFNKVLDSASDKSTRPDFKKVVTDFFTEKIVGKLVEQTEVPGAGAAVDLFKKLVEEVKRAEEAKEKADLREFFVDHKRAVADLEAKVILMKSNFITQVRKTPKAQHEALRSRLIALFEDVHGRLQSTSQEGLFQVLSEAWIGASRDTSGAIAVPASIVIRLYGRGLRVMDATIHGPGGQKIAEQLLKDSPDGVDVINMRVPRYIKWFRTPQDLMPSAMFGMDVDNNIALEGNYAEGSPWPVYNAIMREGVETTKNLTGD
jgi:hypothetical protein